MKTLIFFGSPRKIGHTAELMELFAENLQGEVEIINAYGESISPCIDCRYCWKVKACSIQDGMQVIYKKIARADNIIFASPVYFSSLTSPLKAIVDRLQVYWAENKRKSKSESAQKNGGVILVGGAPSHEKQFLGSELVVDRVFKDLNVLHQGTIRFSNTDRDSLSSKENIKKELIRLAEKINKLNYI